MQDKEQELLKAYFRALSQAEPLSPEEEKELAKRARKGNKSAFQKLMLANLRFVVSIARRYYTNEIDFLDLISAGNHGLAEAIKRFNPDKNVRLISYAAHWIKLFITKELILKSYIVNPSTRNFYYLLMLNSIKDRLRIELEREPTEKEILEEVEHLRLKIKPNLVKKLLKLRTLSLDAPLNENEDATFIDFLSQHSTQDIEDKIIKDELRKEIKNLLSLLPERERQVLILRYGLEDNKERTLNEISQLLNVSKERVRQIEQNALKMLKKHAFTRKLFEFI